MRINRLGVATALTAGLLTAGLTIATSSTAAPTKQPPPPPPFPTSGTVGIDGPAVAQLKATHPNGQINLSELNAPPGKGAAKDAPGQHNVHAGQ